MTGDRGRGSAREAGSPRAAAVPWREAIGRGAPDPADAVRQLRRLEAAAAEAGVALPGDPEAGVVATLCCQRAPYLARLLARDPGRLTRVVADPYLRRQKPRDRIAAEVAAAAATAADAAELAAALRRCRGDELVRCGVREMQLGKPIEVGEELAHLADACFEAAIAFHWRELASRRGAPRFIDEDGAVRPAALAVIAMGKLGGEELNFASDVDVIYVYSSDAAPEDGPELHPWFAELCRHVTAALGEVTADDVVFRVDLRLRPEGSRGAIANSLPSLERYYETWGRPWERQAWLKARPCAGSAALGTEIMELMRPFVYRRSMSADVIAEVESLNRKIKTELDGSGIESGFDVKNGEGGIREIEFFVQALQLIWAGRLPSLRTRSSIGALDQLLFAGIISEAERRALGAAYRFLRAVEHLLQLDSGRQTQRLPADPAALEVLARRLGHPGAESFSAELAAHTAAVAELFATMGDDGAAEPPPGVLAVLSGQLEPAAEIAALAELGFREPELAAGHFERARRLAASPLGPNPQGAASRVAAPLLAEIVRSPDPDQALAYVVELASRRGAWASVWRLMDQSPELLRLVTSLFGTSHYLSRQFIGHPELLDQLIGAGRSTPRVSPGDLAATAAARLAEIDTDDDERRWNALAEIKNEQVLRIGLADIAGELSPLEVCAELSLVADELLARAFELVESAMRAKHGWPLDAGDDEIGFAAFALGKLGGSELGYASDLDLVFVYSGDGASQGRRPLDAVTFMSRFAQRLLGGLGALHPSGRIYQVDTRLRPSGSQGLLVSSLAAWRNYHRGSARLWERQALTKLRHAAGDAAIGRLIEAEVADFLYGGGAAPPQASEIAAGVRRMRARIESELAGRGLDLKVGRGGLVDIEFAAQYLQLVSGPAHPELRTPSTVAALEAAAALELAPATSLAVLIDGYRFLRLIEHRMRIVHDRSVHALPGGGPELDKLARRAGYARADQLTEAFSHFTDSVRRAFDEVVAG
jgi:glutamate-ammonia-ligase adenylyltransferase